MPTSLQLDMLILSEMSKQLAMIELTVPWEDHIEEVNERKRAKFHELVEECRRQGWWAYNEPIKVGCRGLLWENSHTAWNHWGCKKKSHQVHH